MGQIHVLRILWTLWPMRTYWYFKLMIFSGLLCCLSNRTSFFISYHPKEILCGMSVYKIIGEKKASGRRCEPEALETQNSVFIHFRNLHRGLGFLLRSPDLLETLGSWPHSLKVDNKDYFSSSPHYFFLKNWPNWYKNLIWFWC